MENETRPSDPNITNHVDNAIEPTVAPSPCPSAPDELNVADCDNLLESQPEKSSKPILKVAAAIGGAALLGGAAAVGIKSFSSDSDDVTLIEDEPQPDTQSTNAPIAQSTVEAAGKAPGQNVDNHASATPTTPTTNSNVDGEVLDYNVFVNSEGEAVMEVAYVVTSDGSPIMYVDNDADGIADFAIIDVDGTGTFTNIAYRMLEEEGVQVPMNTFANDYAQTAGFDPHDENVYPVEMVFPEEFDDDVTRIEEADEENAYYATREHGPIDQTNHIDSVPDDRVVVTEDGLTTVDDNDEYYDYSIGSIGSEPEPFDEPDPADFTDDLSDF